MPLGEGLPADSEFHTEFTSREKAATSTGFLWITQDLLFKKHEDLQAFTYTVLHATVHVRLVMFRA